MASGDKKVGRALQQGGGVNVKRYISRLLKQTAGKRCPRKQRQVAQASSLRDR